MEQPQLHNVTLYVTKSDFRTTRDFYVALFGGQLVWEEAGHIACVGREELALCIHEAELGHPAGSREFFFHADDLDHVAAALHETGAKVLRRAAPVPDDELHCIDPVGNHVRVHVRRP